MACSKCEDQETMCEIVRAIKEGSIDQNNPKYEVIEKFRKQLEGCLRDILKHREEMLKNLEECNGKDIYKDCRTIQRCLKTIMDYAMMEKSNIDVIIKTVEFIMGELYWTK